MKKAKKTNFLSAYDKDGKPNLKLLSASKKQSGVYFVKDTADKIVYVGYSKTQLYKTIYRHFQSWKDNTQRRATFPRDYKVRIIFTTPERAALIEKFLITQIRPQDNEILYKENELKKYEAEKARKWIGEAEHIPNVDIDSIPDPF